MIVSIEKKLRSIGVSEYKRRRRALVKAMPADSVLILPAAAEVVRNRDVHYPFRQSSDFFYLTGLSEPDAVLVIAPGRNGGEFVLFCHERDPKREIWDGPRVGTDGAKTHFGADEAHPLGKVDKELPKLLEGRRRLYYPVGDTPDLDRQVMDWVRIVRAKARAGVRAPDEFVVAGRLLHELRLFKTPLEVDTMRRAARISAAAHIRLMEACRPGIREYELEAELAYRCGLDGARFQAYPPIVGGGANACTLHYVANQDRLHDGDLILIDAGCELDGYASDITRTFPVNGRFTKPQRELYDLVLAAQQAAIAKAVPGRRWNAPHKAAVRTLTRGLVELGILKPKGKSVARLIKKGKYRPFYMHRTGHWLGMDVHDVGDYMVDGKWRGLGPGMVLTVEPGLYIPPDAEGVPDRYRGVGIRIEDDVLITEDGNEILSRDAPKDADAIEALMAG